MIDNANDSQVGDDDDSEALVTFEPQISSSGDKSKKQFKKGCSIKKNGYRYPNMYYF